MEVILIYQTVGYIVLDGKREKNCDFYLMTLAEELISELSEFDVVISIENI